MNYAAISGRLVWLAAALLALMWLPGCPFAPPFADFSASPTEGAAPLAVQFTAAPGEGSTPIDAFAWDFGDGTQSAMENPAHVYEAPGLYRVSLTVSNRNGSTTRTRNEYIRVRAEPAASFSGAPRAGTPPLSVRFLDESDTGPHESAEWLWDFGDGETSTDRNPVHEYVQPGEYEVSLTVTTDGGTNTVVRPGYIVVSAVPMVDFDASPTGGSAPLNVQFTDRSMPGTSAITSWFWEFGDGTTSSAQNPLHIYSAPGSYTVSLTARNDAGEATRTRADLITVTQRPAAAFSAAPREGAAPLAVSFLDESLSGSAPIEEWLWDFGDGTSSSERNPIHEFAASGAYDVSLTVTSAAGTSAVLRERYIVAQARPAADFSASVRQGEAPLTVEFQDLSTPGDSPITGRQWSFGDGAFSGDARPAHTYTAPGIYTVSLRVESAVGSGFKAEPDYIVVTAPPASSFTATPQTGQTPLSVSFTDTSSPGSSPITEWLWDFGDGTTSTDQHPTRVYSNPGRYTVTLTVTTEDGESTSTRNELIRAVQAPRADFTADVTGGVAPLAVQFRDASDPGSEPITARVWDFGDGNTSTVEDPLHTYAQPGNFTVSLTVTTAAGLNTARKTEFVTVTPDVTFTATPATGLAPATVSFADTTDASPFAIGLWAWDFGDGGSSDLPTTSHTYTQAGSYDVTLTITTDQGEATTTRAGAVRLRPTPAFSAAPRDGVGAPHDLQFMDETDPGNLEIVGWEWDFGDGRRSTQQNPSHSYAAPGVYNVTLTVQTDLGASATRRDGFVVVRPAAAFSADVTQGVDSLAVQFSDETEPGSLEILTWAWDFGDGATSALRNPAHTYTQPGTYTVSLTINSTQGADTEIKAGYIVVAPDVQFSASAMSGPAPLAVTFTDTTNTGLLETTARVWTLGEGDPVMDEEAPMYEYMTPGLYDVSLTITTTQGEASRVRTGFIMVQPVLDVTAMVTPGAGTAMAVFTNNTDPTPLTEVTWAWDFGDGNTSTEAAPTHEYMAPGIYEARVTMDSAEGVTATALVTTVEIDPIVSFTATPDNVMAMVNVNFEDTSNIGNLTVSARAWDFGDGESSTDESPAHSYAAAGSYMVSLTITTELGDFTVDTPVTVTVSAKDARAWFDWLKGAEFLADALTAQAPVARFDDGGWAAALHDAAGLVLIRSDDRLAPIWAVDLSALRLERVSAIYPLAEGGLLVAGADADAETRGALALLRLDEDGEFRWRVALPDQLAADVAAVADAPASDVYVLAVPNGAATRQSVCYRIGAGGEVVWRVALHEVACENWGLRVLDGGGVVVYGEQPDADGPGTWEWRIGARGDGSDLR